MRDLAIWERMVRRPKTSVLALHTRPDGDAIASNLALARVLTALGHDITVVSPQQPSRRFAFLAGFDRIDVRAPDQVAWDDYDNFWALDLADPSMLGAAVTFPADLTILVIDHHVTNDGWGTVNLIDPAAPSTTALLWQLFQALGLPVDADLATCLLTGLATDTGFFAYSVTPQTLRLGADLIALGADYQDISFRVTSQTPIAVVRAVGRSLQQAQLFPKERLAVVTIPWETEDAPRAGAVVGLLTRQITTIAGTDAGAVLIEERPGKIRIELRARTPGYDVAAIAVALGGGGHRAAAGARFSGTLDEAIAAIRRVMDERAGSER